jgi:hypothetical protein
MYIVHSFEGLYPVREPTLKKYLALVKRMENYFKDFTVEYIERSRNTEFDELVKVAACNTPLLTDVFFHVMEDASVKTIESEPRLINVIEGEDWRVTIMAYLCHYYNSHNTTQAYQNATESKAYQIIDNDLYKTFISDPLL